MNGWQLTTGFLLACGLYGFASGPTAHGQVRAADKPAKAVSFDGDIRPILDRCMKCHGPGRARAGLRLDSPDAAMARLPSGNRAIVPGQPEHSELLRRVSAADADKRMPFKSEPLGTDQVDKLRRWIAGGAAWSLHWAYRPLSRPALPGSVSKNPSLALRAGRTSPDASLAQWPRTPLDLFITAKLAEHGLEVVIYDAFDKAVSWRIEVREAR